MHEDYSFLLKCCIKFFETFDLLFLRKIGLDPGPCGTEPYTETKDRITGKMLRILFPNFKTEPSISVDYHAVDVTSQVVRG